MSALCVFMIHNGFHESLLNSFLASRLHYSFSCTCKQAPSTELIHCKQNLPIVPQTRKCIISLFKGNHKHFGAKGSRSDCGSWQSPSSSGWPSCDQAQSQIIRPSCRSCRMASLYGVTCLTSQWRVCSDLPVTSAGVSAAPSRRRRNIPDISQETQTDR